jgi:putative ABC transport system permease protein
VLSRQLENELPEESKTLYKGLALRIRPLRNSFVDASVQRTLWILMGAIGFVLLIACANMANLQLARAEPRTREVCVRMAMGAGRGRILRQCLTESLLLSLAGGVLGLVVAFWGSKAMVLLVPSYAPVMRALGIDATVLGCAFILAGGAGIVFGLYPAWRMARLSLGESLKESTQMTSAGGGRRWFRNGLIVGEVALAMVLSVGGALMLNSVLHLLRQEPGFDPENLARIEVRIPRVLFADDKLRKLRFQELADRLAAMPGCTAVGTSSGRGAYGVHITPKGDTRPVFFSEKCVGVGKNDWFKALRVPLIEGRWFEDADASRGQVSVLVNLRLARLFWPGQSAVGKKIPQLQLEVVGVVGNFEEWRGGKEPEPTLYEPFERVGSIISTFYVRSTLDQASLRQNVRQAVRGVFPPTTEPQIEWLEQALYASTYSHRLYAHFLCGFAAAGLFLAGVGVFGVLAYSVTRRTREIGIRMALGSEKHQIVALVMRQGARLLLGGLGIGMLASLGLTRLLESQLFEVRPIDPLSILVGATVLIGVGLLASYLPARRAAKVDPVVALRSE